MKSPTAPLTREGELYLARLIAQGDEQARHELILANLPVVVSIARRYKNRGVDMDDLIQEGQLGLHRATKSFDPTLGFRFATHAQWWIRQRISRLVRNTRNSVRVSGHAQERYAAVVRKQGELAAELGRDPDLQELALACGRDQKQLGQILQLAATVHSFSLDETRQDGETSCRDRIQDPQPTPVEHLERLAQDRFVDEVLSKLTPREEKVLRMRYGIGGHPDLELGQLEPVDQQAQYFIEWVEQRSLERLQAELQ